MRFEHVHRFSQSDRFHIERSTSVVFSGEPLAHLPDCRDSPSLIERNSIGDKASEERASILGGLRIVSV
jgi:hypothetical protein